MARFWAPNNDSDYNLLKTAAIEGNEDVLRSLNGKGIRLDALIGYEDSDGMTALHTAAYNGHVNIIQLLLAYGVDVDIEDVDSFAIVTPIYYAALGAHPEAIKVLLKAGARTDSIGPNEESVLSAVLLQPHGDVKAKIDSIALLLDSGMDINGRGEGYGPTVLELAVKNNDHEVIHFLNDQGASFEEVLLQAVRHNDPSLFHVLIDAGATDIAHQALTYAAGSGKVKAVEILLSHKETVKLAVDCSDAVGAAAKNGHLKILTLLLDHGFALNKPDRHGLTPLHQVTCGAMPQMEAMQLLLDRGADLLARNIKVSGPSFCDDISVLQLAGEECHTSMIRKLVETQPEILKLKCRKGECAGDSAFLTFARNVGRRFPLESPSANVQILPARVLALQMLLDAGADINETDRSGRTALHIIAANKGADSEKVVAMAAKLLLERGLDTNIQDNDGCRAHEVAAHEEIAELLAVK